MGIYLITMQIYCLTRLIENIQKENTVTSLSLNTSNNGYEKNNKS